MNATPYKDRQHRLDCLMYEMHQSDPVEVLGTALGAYRMQRPHDPITLILDALFAAAAEQDTDSLTKKNGPAAWARSYTRARPLLFTGLTRAEIVRELDRLASLDIREHHRGLFLATKGAALVWSEWPTLECGERPASFDALLASIIKALGQVPKTKRDQPDLLAKNLLRACGMSAVAAGNAVTSALGKRR
jgi:hypothetical protein